MSKLLISTIIIISMFGYSSYSQTFNFGSTWKYFDGGNPNNPSWKTDAYAELSWPSGPTEMGYGDNDEATTLSFGGSSSNKIITSYFRKDIQLDTTAEVKLRIKYDDGYVLYWNGTEIGRGNMPTGIISHNTLAINTFENQITTLTIPASLTEKGINQIAVEVHQNSPSSSDLSFDFEIFEVNYLLPPVNPPPPGLYINEVLASNDSKLADPTGKFEDWIELFNNTGASIDLANFYISDNPDLLTKFRFNSSPGLNVIPPYSYYILWASGDITKGPNHLPFSLSADGEAVYLTSPNGTGIIDQLVFGKQRTDVSIGRLYSNIDSLVYYSPPNPMNQNTYSNAYKGILSNPVASHESGFYLNNFNLSISFEPGSTVYYTLDGSEPKNNTNPDFYFYKNIYPAFENDIAGTTYQNPKISNIYNSSILVSNPINVNILVSNISTTFTYPFYLPNNDFQVDKCRVVAFKAEKSGYLPSETIYKSYFIGNRNFSLPVLSLQISPEKYFDLNEGIAVAGQDFLNWRAAYPGENGYFGTYNFLRKVGVNGYFNYFENQILKLKNSVEVKIHGGTTRWYPLKSLRLKTNENLIEADFFKTGKNELFDGFVLRNGGNSNAKSYILDVAVHNIVSDFRIEKMRFNPVTLFINGEYWGILNQRDRIDNDFFEIKYKLNKDLIEIGENGTVENTSGDYESLVTYVLNNDFTDQTKYNYLKTKIDVNSFIDYTIAQSFFGNSDALNSNYGYWRYKGPKLCENCAADNRWRWFLFDTDISFDGATSPFEVFYSWRGNQYFYKYIKSNSEFRNEFVNRYADALNSYFKYSNIAFKIDSLANMISLEMPKHIQRWDEPVSYNAWNSYVNNLKAFCQNRGSTVLNYIIPEMSLTGTFGLTISVDNISKGYIKVNTININSSTAGIPSNYTSWTGTYFDNIPVTIIAKPKKGYKFSHWIHNGQTLLDSVLTITTSNDVTYQAFFEVEITSQNPKPKAYNLAQCSYKFKSWEENAPAGTYPPNMRFVYYNDSDPKLSDKFFADSTYGAYNHISRTRINGLGNLGVSFINTTGSNFNVGYPIGKLGGAVLAISTEGIDSVMINWKARTIAANDRKYALRLMYRIGDNQEFSDFDPPVEYIGATTGDSAVFPNLKLPQSAVNQPYVQLLWRYYHYSGDSGSRDQLAIDDIEINTIKLLQSLNNLQLDVSTPSYIESFGPVIESNVILNASKSIYLNPGMEVKNGSVFKAQISTCQD